MSAEDPTRKEAEPEVFEVRRALPEDAEQIEEVFYKTWLATYPNEEHGITTEDIETKFKHRRDPAKIEKKAELLRLPSEGELRIVAKKGDKVIGLAFASKTKWRNNLLAIYVLPEYQGKKVGKLLWEEIQQFINPTNDTYVEVASYNINAINFYTSLGFTDTGRHFSDERYRMISGAIIPEMEMVLPASITSPSGFATPPKG